MFDTGFKVVRYQLKSAVELSKILLLTEDYSDVQHLLTAIQIGKENVLQRYPEILDEINHILVKVGSETTFVEGKIVHINLISDFILIEKNDQPGENFIAGKLDFVPILNSLSNNLLERRVKFVAKTYRTGNKEKREAKNIRIIS
jgi:hypothetical protein